MVHLDRENGAILLPNGSVVPYDVLVLCTGLQVRGPAALYGRGASTTFVFLTLPLDSGA